MFLVAPVLCQIEVEKKIKDGIPPGTKNNDILTENVFHLKKYKENMFR